MKIAITSDTHYSVDRFISFLNQIRKQQIKTVIHAGDYDGFGIEHTIVDYIEIKFYIALGNCDHDYQKNSYLKSQPHVLIGDVLYFDVAGFQVALSHIPGVAESQLQGEPVDVWIHGHTHRLKNKLQNGVLQLNPGSLMDESGYLILDTESRQAVQHFVK